MSAAENEPTCIECEIGSGPEGPSWLRVRCESCGALVRAGGRR